MGFLVDNQSHYPLYHLLMCFLKFLGRSQQQSEKPQSMIQKLLKMKEEGLCRIILHTMVNCISACFTSNIRQKRVIWVSF
jgi:hypothetical protein